MANDIITSKKYILDFIKSKLNGNFNELKEVDFLKFTSSREKDPDDLLIIRCIFYILHCNDISGLKLNEIGQGKKYRGDTINSFNSLFGWAIDEKEDNLEKNKSLKMNKESVRKRVKEVIGIENYKNFIDKINCFNKNYHRLGNFLLMYNKEVSNDTINCKRGKSILLQDFFDLFLLEVKDKITKGICTQELNNYFDEECICEYFKGSLTEYCERYYLTMYIKDNDVLLYEINDLRISSYPKEKGRWRVLLNLDDDDIENYYKVSTSFIKEVLKRINVRGNQMLLELERKLK